MTTLRGSAGDRSLLRRMNTQAAWSALRAGPRTVTQLADELNLSRTALDDIVKDLMELGWIRDEDDPDGRTRPGRPARRYHFNATAGLVAGLDIGVHNVTALLADLSGEIHARARVATAETASVTTRLKVADRALHRCLADVGAAMDDLWCVGVGAPGVIADDGTVTRYGGLGMPGWTGTNLRRLCRNRWNVPVIVESDNNLGVIAEHWQGSARDARNVVYILSGNRTSAGLLIDGRPHRGHGGGAGLVGALPELGWAEAPDYVDRLKDTPIAATREAMFEAAAAGDRRARTALEGFSRSLAKGIAAMSLAVDPELIVLGGGVSKGGDTILEPVRRHLEDLSGKDTPLVLSELGSDAVALGAVKVALEQIDRSLAQRADREPSFPQAMRDIAADSDMAM